jgi:hypothetical protein
MSAYSKLALLNVAAAIHSRRARAADSPNLKQAHHALAQAYQELSFWTESLLERRETLSRLKKGTLADSVLDPA